MKAPTVSLPDPVSLNSVEQRPTPTAPWLAVVAEKVRGLHFGSVQITVHDSRVVQVERIERTRIDGSRLG